MPFHMCRVSHNPPESYGDCIRACYASLLDVDDPLTVPHFSHDAPDLETLDKREREYLRDQHSLAPFRALFPPVPLDEVLNAMQAQNPGIHYMLIGSTAGGVNHAVVCHGDRIVHNPGWTKPRIVGAANGGYYGVTVFVPYDMVK